MALINKQQEYQDQEAWSDSIEKLKEYKELKEKVEYWAKQKDSADDLIIEGPYEIVFDNELGWCVDVDGYVYFSGSDIKEIPFQFRNVSGNFSCYKCKNLTSLEGCPKEVNNDFWCIDCGNHFTKEYIQSLCNVKGRIFNL